MAKIIKTRTKPTLSKGNSLKPSSKTNKSEVKANNVQVSFFSKIKKRLVSFVGKIRDWLNLNKVFFETLAATTLTIMAVIFAWSQLKVAEEQTSYLHQQTIIERNQALPQIMVIQEGVDSIQSVNEEKISIYNQVNIVRHTTIFSRCFFIITSYDGTKSKKIRVPIAGYYDKPKLTQNSTGLLATIDNEKMFTKIEEIENEIQRLSFNKYVTFTFGIERNIEVYYQDIFGEAHYDYFYLNPVFGPELQDPFFADDIAKNYSDGLREMPDFATVTAEELLNLLDNK